LLFYSLILFGFSGSLRFLLLCSKVSFRFFLCGLVLPGCSQVFVVMLQPVPFIGSAAPPCKPFLMKFAKNFCSAFAATY
jgi:hypothetical protein